MENKRQDISQKVSGIEKISYVLANLGNIPIQALIGSYLLIFYTNVCGLNPAACATLFLVARILDGINDPLVGFCIDHVPNTKMGHFRPTLMVGTILCSANFALLWFGPMMAASGKLVIAYISYLLIGVLFPVMDISLNSMLPVMTTDMKERNALSSIKGVAYTLGYVGFTMLAPIILGETSNADGYVKLIVMAIVIIMAFSILGAFGMKERVLPQAGKRYGLKDLVYIITQKPVGITFLMNLCYMVGTNVVNAANVYFYSYVLGDLKMLSIVSMLPLIPSIVMMTFIGPLITRFGKKKLYCVGLVGFGIMPLLRLVNVTNIPILLAATFLGGCANGLITPIMYGIQADNTDYVELVTGQRTEGAIASLSSFVTKCGMGIGGAIPGYILAAVGFDQTLTVQPAGVNSAIVLCVIVIPSILYFVGAAVFAKFYPLTKEKLDEQNAILEKKCAEV